MGKKKFVCPDCKQESCTCGFCDPCPSCTKSVSPLLDNCPHCGAVVNEPPPKAGAKPKVDPKPGKKPTPAPEPAPEPAPPKRKVKEAVKPPEGQSWAEPWMGDGKRYSVGVQKGKEKNCWQDYDDYDTLTEAQGVAEEQANKTGLSVIVYDRKNPTGNPIVFKYDPSVPAEPEVEPTKGGKKK